MRQSITLFMKSILRIAIFSLGGLLAITGIMSGSYALVKLPDGASKFMPFVVIAVFSLPGGISLCFLAIKLPHYLVKYRKMSKEERVIENIKTYMKKGKSRIATCTIFLVVMIATSMWIMSMGNKLAETMTPEHIRLLAAAKLMVGHYLFGLFTGFIAFMLIDEFAGFTKNKHRLTLSMWERIQQLENEVKGLKAHTQADDRQIDGMDVGDVVVN